MLGAKFTVIAVEPLTGEIVKVDAACWPAETEIGFRALAVSLKSGASDAFHAGKRTSKSIEPRPVTEL